MVYATVVGCLLAAAAYALEHLAASYGWARRWVWLGAMLALPLVPLFTSELPPVLSTAATTGTSLPVGTTLSLPASAPAASTSTGSAPASMLIGALDLVTAPWRGSDITAAATAALGRVHAQLVQIARLDHWFVGTWIAVSALLIVGYIVAALRLAAQRRRWLSARVDGTDVLIASDVGPAVVGTVRPAIVLPLWALSIEPALRSLILLHEREHLRARDPLAIHLTALATYLLPWNVPLWWMSRRLRLAIEVDCDQRVLRAGGNVRRYADLLLTVGSRRLPARVLAPALVEGKSFLARRITAMCPDRSKFRYLRLVCSGGAAYLLIAMAYAIPRPALAQKTQPAELAIDALMSSLVFIPRDSAFFQDMPARITIDARRPTASAETKTAPRPRKRPVVVTRKAAPTPSMPSVTGAETGAFTAAAPTMVVVQRSDSLMYYMLDSAVARGLLSSFSRGSLRIASTAVVDSGTRGAPRWILNGVMTPKIQFNLEILAPAERLRPLQAVIRLDTVLEQLPIDTVVK